MQRARASLADQLTHDVLSEAYIDARNFYFGRGADPNDEQTIDKMVQILMGRLKPLESERDSLRESVATFVNGIQTYPGPAADAKKEDAAFVLAPMKRGAFAKEIETLGCEYVGKDGSNHDIYRNPATGRTTSLGIGGHGSNVSQDAGVQRTYLTQLGITPSQWNSRS